LSVYLSYFGKDSGYHSIANSPNSFYGQLLSEYGIAGLMCFLLFYILYFVKRKVSLSYGWPVLFIFLGSLITDYWFEQLSIVIMFELMMLLDMREMNEKNPISL
jgi:hypothetical protein